jgi:hypothetical protein
MSPVPLALGLMFQEEGERGEFLGIYEGPPFIPPLSHNIIVS